LVEQLRKSSIVNIHTINTNFGYDVKLRHRINRDRQETLVCFNEKTLLALNPVTNDEVVDILANITRLNINTGNGRLRVKGETVTVAFGFPSRYKEVKIAAKKRFSKNLDYNNGIDSDSWEFIKLRVTKIELKDGRIVKYLVMGIYDE
jgi:hypothetical protein